MDSNSLIIPSQLEISKAGKKSGFVVFTRDRIVFVPYNFFNMSPNILYAVFVFICMLSLSVLLWFEPDIWFWGIPLLLGVIWIIVERHPRISKSLTPIEYKVRQMTDKLRDSATNQDFKQFETLPGYFETAWSNIFTASVESEIEYSRLSLVSDDTLDVDILGYNASGLYHERSEMARSIKMYLSKNFPEKNQESV